MFHPDDRDRAWAAWRHSLATRRAVRDRVPLAAPQRRVPLDARPGAARAGRARGRSTRWFGTCTDIDALKQLMDEREALLAGERAARARPSGPAG